MSKPKYHIEIGIAQDAHDATLRTLYETTTALEATAAELAIAQQQAADRAGIIEIIARQRDEFAGENKDFGELLRAQHRVLVELEAECRALWDAVIGFMNSPGSIEHQSVETYSAMVRLAMESRFWKEACGE